MNSALPNDASLWIPVLCPAHSAEGETPLDAGYSAHSAKRSETPRTVSTHSTTNDGISTIISSSTIATLTSSSTIVADVRDLYDLNGRTLSTSQPSQNTDFVEAASTRQRLSWDFDERLPECEDAKRARSVQSAEATVNSASSKTRRLKYARGDGSKCFVMQDDKIWIRLQKRPSFASLSALQPTVFHELKEHRRAARIIPPLACFRSGDGASISSSSLISIGDISVSESTRRSLSRLFDDDLDVHLALKRRNGDSLPSDQSAPLGESPAFSESRHSSFSPHSSDLEHKQGQCIVLSDSEYPPVELPGWLLPRLDSKDSSSGLSDISEG
eukprot:GEMP01070606.1.p1 GENE.GEMP01070606.1~~GEMP01070606.1.p1  ORF type:complete len:329 (+),score=50.98 GEMP01070606.1:50-1036(+)